VGTLSNQKRSHPPIKRKKENHQFFSVWQRHTSPVYRTGILILALSFSLFGLDAVAKPEGAEGNGQTEFTIVRSNEFSLCTEQQHRVIFNTYIVLER
jgi:hypothetical protein